MRLASTIHSILLLSLPPFLSSLFIFASRTHVTFFLLSFLFPPFPSFLSRSREMWDKRREEEKKRAFRFSSRRFGKGKSVRSFVRSFERDGEGWVRVNSRSFVRALVASDSVRGQRNHRKPSVARVVADSQIGGRLLSPAPLASPFCSPSILFPRAPSFLLLSLSLSVRPAPLFRVTRAVPTSPRLFVNRPRNPLHPLFPPV